MAFRKRPSLRAHRQLSPKYGIHIRRLIRVSKEELEGLNTLRFPCNLCKHWLPALAFYAQVLHLGSEASDDSVCLERYEVKAEDFKGRETVVIFEDCAADIGQG